MSQINGLAPSADWIAKDMEAMLRECDVVVASKDEHLTRLSAGVAALQAEIEQVGKERASALADREKAKRVLDTFRSAMEEGAGLRESRAHGPARPRIVTEPLDQEAAPATETGPDSPQPEEAAAQAARGRAPEGHPAATRVTGERSIAVMELITREPDRAWTPNDVALRLDGEDKGQDPAAINRARALLDNLAKKKALDKSRDEASQRCVFRLAAEGKAA